MIHILGGGWSFNRPGALADMARPREFDIDVALERAMQLFWLRGFHATTTRDLDAALGIGHQSMYNAFGDKASLFRQTLDRYLEREMGPRIEGIEEPAAGKREVVRFFAQVVEFHDLQTPRKGCLVFSVALELLPDNAEAGRFVRDFRERLNTAFEQALRNGIARGEIDSAVDVHVAAGGLLCTLMGLAAAARSGMDRESLVDMASNALRPLY